MFRTEQVSQASANVRGEQTHWPAFWRSGLFASMLTASVVMLGAGFGPSAHASLFSLPRMFGIVHLERIAFDSPALPPMAHSRFCLQYPADCEVRRTFWDRNIALTPGRWSELLAVNRAVNRSIVPQRNLGGIATEEWLVAPKAGDCNDYAVTKRHELLARGWPSRALILSEVVTTWGEHHLVLVVRTVQGDFVMDSLNHDIRPVAKARYRWVRAQSQDNPKFWSTVRVTASAPNVAVRASKPKTTHFRFAYLHNRAARTLRKSQTENCCPANGRWSA